MSFGYFNRALTLVGCTALTVAEIRETAQQPDVIALDGKEYALLVNPLEVYLAQNPQRRPRASMMSSANWRGHVAHFAVVDRDLVVSDVRVDTGMVGDQLGARSALSEVLPGSARVVATWFTGNLIIPDGVMTSYVHMGYGSQYERYIVIQVAAGVVGARRQLNLDDFAALRKAQFDAFKQTPEYREAFAKASREVPTQSAADTELFLFHYTVADYMARIVR